MAAGKILGVRNVSAKEMRELLKLPSVADDDVLSQLSDHGPARVLPDGRVLLCNLLGKGGVLYPSRATAEEVNRQCAETEREVAEQSAGRVPDPIVTLLPPIDDFLRDVEEHAKSLGPRIKVAGVALDGTIESLGAVDKALKRIPWATRQVPDLVTPLVAYVGEVLRRASGGRWLKSSHERQVAVCDPEERLAQLVANRKLLPSALAAADKAAAEAKARGASDDDVKVTWSAARRAVMDQVPRLKSYRIEVREDNDAVVVAPNGRSFQPFAIVFIPMVEPSKRGPLRAAVETHLIVSGYPPKPSPSAQPAPRPPPVDQHTTSTQRSAPMIRPLIAFTMVIPTTAVSAHAEPRPLPAPTAPAASSSDRALAFLQLLVARRFDDATTSFAERVRAKVSTTQLRTLWDGLVTKHGSFADVTEIHVKQDGALSVVDLGVRFERATVRVTVAFDAEDRVAGLWFRP